MNSPSSLRLLLSAGSLLAGLLPVPHATAALIEHITFNNASTGGGTGADTTSAGGFDLTAATGSNGRVRANAHTYTGTEITGANYHAQAGQTGKLNQALRINNPAPPASGTISNPANGNGGVNIPNVPPPGKGDYTVSMWVNFLGQTQGTLSSSTTGGGFLFGFGSNTTSSGREGLSIFYDKTGGNMVFRFGSGDSGDANVESGGGVASPDHRAGVSIPVSIDSNWHLVTLVVDSNGTSATVSGYVDGSATGASAGGGGAPDDTALLDTDGLNNAADVVTLGTRGISVGAATPNNYGTTWVLRGVIDDLAIWNQALTASEVSALYQNGLAGLDASAPLVDPDLDDDGMPNEWEAQYPFLNVNNAADAALDQDSDGLTNREEYENGTLPNNPDTDGDGVNDGPEKETHLTNPLVADSDGDGLNDGAEINTHHTNPLVADSDGDGLTDGAEVNTHLTNPLLADTDNDKFSDYVEVNSNGDPLNAAIKPPVALQNELLLYFTFDAADVSGNSVLDRATAAGGPFNGTKVNGGPTAVAGKFGDGGEFAGGANNSTTSPYLDLTSHVAGLNALTEGTIAAWVNTPAAGLQTDVLTVFAISNSTEPSSECRFFVSNGVSVGTGNLVYAVREDNAALGSAISPTPGPLLDGSWHHVAVTFSAASGKARVFIDGRFITEGTSAFFSATNGADRAAIGRNLDNTAGGGQWFFDGTMDDFAMWKRPLTLGEIAHIYNEGTAGRALSAASPPGGLDEQSITGVQVAPNGDVSITWKSVTGVRYGLEFSSTMAAGSWMEVDDITATGPSTTLIDNFSHLGNSRGFYRIRQL